ncbi:MAG: hypothetical protein IT427_07655 [Pirellulales bacterium]|nr:hypothetical protein [Pirellulales bacterium]
MQQSEKENAIAASEAAVAALELDQGKNRRLPHEEVAKKTIAHRPNHIHREFSLESAQKARELIESFPDIFGVTDLRIRDVVFESIPDELLKQLSIHGKNLESLQIGTWHLPSEKKAPAISDVGMEYISKLDKLKQLSLTGNFPGDGFEKLSKLTCLRTLGLSHPTLNAKEFFGTVSKLPNIYRLSVIHADFSQPIDEATHKAIASLNGRLESLSFGEAHENEDTVLHESTILAITDIESLTWLEPGITASAFVRVPKGNGASVVEYVDNLIARKLPYVENFRVSEPLTKDGKRPERILVLQDYMRPEHSPVQFRNVNSPAAMFVLLQHILGRQEADKVRKEVVRRRAGLAPKTDFTESGSGLADILEESFGVTVYPNSKSMLNTISHSHPELNKAIRKYLSGKDLP